MRRRWTRPLLVGAGRTSRRSPCRRQLPPEVVRADDHAHRARRDHPGGPARRADVVLQDLLAGVRDRVVIAVTFLAMLELMKRREIVVEQAEPWGPIVARATTAEERAAGLASATDADDAPLDESLESFA